jgi:hypothetical protein
MPIVDVTFHYFNKNSMHAKNERALFATKCLSIFDWIEINVPSKHKLKNVQFISIYHLLSHGHPMTKYGHMKGLFQLLKSNLYPKNIGLIR